MDFWAWQIMASLALICVIIFVEVITDNDCKWFSDEIKSVRLSCPFNAFIYMVIAQEIR